MTHIPPSMKNAEIESALKSFGQLWSCKVSRKHKDGAPRLPSIVAWAEYMSIAAAAAALSKGTLTGPRGEYAKIVPHQDR